MTYAIIHYATHSIVSMYDDINEARHDITDMFGPKYHTVYIKEVSNRLHVGDYVFNGTYQDD